jgi:N-methylhydantoinase B
MLDSAPTAAPTRLRDLTDEEFRDLYACDRFTASVLANRLRYSVQHVATGLLHRAFSPIIALSYDFAAAICAPPKQDYSMAAVTNGLVVFLGTMADGVRAAVEEFGVERLTPGDLLICNDPSRMGNHPNDVCFIRPVFHDGEVVSFMVIRAHQTDMGGSIPGGFSGLKRTIYENGLIIGPRLLFHAGAPVRETFSLICDNVRYAEQLLPDLHTIHGCCALGEQLLEESIEKYGIDAYLGVLEYSCDSTAESMRNALATLPDGVYEGTDIMDADGVDDTEEYRIRLKLTKRGHRAEVDFSGTSRQARTCINAGALDAKTAVGVGLKTILDPFSAFTSGSFRDIDIVIPPGTMASALPPDGAIMLYWEVASVIMSALLQALAGALGEDAVGGDYGSNSVHNGYGQRADGSPFAVGGLLGGEMGPTGGSREGDGEGHSSLYLLNIMSPSAESLEHDFPVRVLRKEFVADSGGPGLHRGGPAILKDVMWTGAAEHQSMPMRLRDGSGHGVYGGRPGDSGGVWIFDQDGAPTEGEQVFVSLEPDVYAQSEIVAGRVNPQSKVVDREGEYAYFGRVPVWRTMPGATWRYLTNAGGGWGDPFHRDPDRVKADVRDGYVSIEGAARDYGVVVTGDPDEDPEGLQIDVEATRVLRADRASEEA